MYGTQEGYDGYDCIKWTARQPWCNDKVAMAGNLWLATTQWFIASEQPPHLTYMAPWEGLGDSYRESMCRGGISDHAFWDVSMGWACGKRCVLLMWVWFASLLRRKVFHRTWDARERQVWYLERLLGRQEAEAPQHYYSDVLMQLPASQMGYISRDQSEDSSSLDHLKNGTSSVRDEAYCHLLKFPRHCKRLR